jgi:hypothetical protein
MEWVYYWRSDEFYGIKFSAGALLKCCACGHRQWVGYGKRCLGCRFTESEWLRLMAI